MRGDPVEAGQAVSTGDQDQTRGLSGDKVTNLILVCGIVQ